MLTNSYISNTLVDSLPKGTTVETVVLLSKGEVDSKKIRVEFSLEDMDMSEFQDEATYPQIKAYVLEHGRMYNPFWKCLAEDCGTLKYCETSRYKTYNLLYDQILVNKQILEGYEVTAMVLDIDRQLVNGEHRPVAVELLRR